jgi:hypothetical protein
MIVAPAPVLTTGVLSQSTSPRLYAKQPSELAATRTIAARELSRQNQRFRSMPFTSEIFVSPYGIQCKNRARHRATAIDGVSPFGVAIERRVLAPS